VLKASDDIKAEKMAMKKAIVGDIVKSLMEVKILEPIEERIADDNLDSLLKFAFAENGINTEFNYAIYDGHGKLHYTNEDSASQEIARSKYRVILFPNDLIGDLSILKVYFPKQTGYLLQANSMMVISSMLIVLVILYIFYWTVRAIISQKRNSEIKNDFINNMTHELKTPISTISLACEVLSDPTFASDENASTRYIGMISEENKRLGMLVEEVLQSAVLDKGGFQAKN
jgi:two-component system phosphate regulon sensor histidine kinase PhoR